MKKNLNILFIFIVLTANHIIFPQSTLWENISYRIPGDSLTNLSDVFMASPSIGWISSHSTPEIYRTTDFCETWEIQTTQSPIKSLFLNVLEGGYAGGTDGTIYKTTDFLGNWFSYGSIGSSIADIVITYQYFDWRGYVCGEGGTVWAINDTGLVNLSSGFEVDYSGISARIIDNVWLCGDSSVYFYDGNTYTNKFNAPVKLNSISYKYMSDIWVVGDSGFIAHSADSGYTWVVQSNPDSLNRSLNDVFFTNIYGWGYGLAVGDSGVIIRTSNFGNTWQMEAEGLTEKNLRSVHFNELYLESFGPGVIVGDNKTVLFNPLIVSIDNEIKLPIQFMLNQNYPNPFNPTTIIKYQIPELSYVRIKVFDVIGNEIEALVNEEKSAGEYEIEFDGTNLTSGVYFYQLRAGDYTETKKMILLR